MFAHTTTEHLNVHAFNDICFLSVHGPPWLTSFPYPTLFRLYIKKKKNETKNFYSSTSIRSLFFSSFDYEKKKKNETQNFYSRTKNRTLFFSSFAYEKKKKKTRRKIFKKKQQKKKEQISHLPFLIKNINNHIGCNKKATKDTEEQTMRESYNM